MELACFDNTASSYIVVEFPARALSGAAKPEILFVHEDMNAHYFMEQLCSQALGAPLQREFKDWIALGHAPSTRSLLASRGGFPVSGNKSGTPLEPDWNGVSLVSLAP
ncbi:MAG: hypothetical protein KDK25_14540 [Leptospiraceae bacterium]|nr:hypothetical protein [Leptospiraceae bacterium]